MTHRLRRDVSAGMAGSGKTTLLQRLNSELHIRKTPGYIINLDPAVLNVPYSPNVDIRDTVRAPARRVWKAFLARLQSLHTVGSPPADTHVRKRCMLLGVHHNKA